MISGIDALNIHLAALAKTLELVSRSVETTGVRCLGQWSITSVGVCGYGRARWIRKGISLEDYQDAGIHTFDDFVLLEAARELKRP